MRGGPPVNWLLRLDVESSQADDGTATGLPSRVEDVEDDVLVVAAPSLAVAHVVDRGAVTIVRWTDVRGLHAIPTVVEDITRGVLPRWRLRPVGDVEIVQRRRYVRVPYVSQVAVVPHVERLGAVVGGFVADLSEGGVRLLLGSAMHAGPSDEIVVHLDVDGEVLEVRGTIVGTGTVKGPLPHEVRVSFAEPNPHADRLRRVVMRRLIEQRKRATS